MIKQLRIPTGLIWVVLAALAVSLLLSYSAYKQEPDYEPANEAVLTIIPEYTIASGIGTVPWPGGTVFEQGRAAYFYAAGPELTVTPIITVTGMEYGFLNGTIAGSAVLKAVDDKSQEYWSYVLKSIPEHSFILTGYKEEQAGSGSFVCEPVNIDVKDAYDMAMQIGSELMFQSGSLLLEIITYVNINGSIDGIGIDKAITHELSVKLMPVSFSIPRTRDAVVELNIGSGVRKQTMGSTIAEKLNRNKALFLTDMVLMAALMLLLVIKHMGRNKADAQHRRYREWITEGITDVRDKFSINVFSLEGLVDIAIDMNKRVIHDPRTKKYIVLTEDIVYIYDAENVQSLLENRQQLGKLLLEKGLLTTEQLEVGLYYRKKTGVRLGESLIALGFLDETSLYGALAAQAGLDYYEIDPRDYISDRAWIDKMSIQKARALMALPLGVREDGRLVVACGEISRDGIRKALQEMLGEDIYLLAAKPSAIHEILNRIEKQERDDPENSTLNTGKASKGRESLSDSERKEFIASYYKGNIRRLQLIKAIGLVDEANLTKKEGSMEADGYEAIMNRLVGMGIIRSGIVSLMEGLAMAIKDMDMKAWRNKQVPSLLQVLFRANYLTEDTAEWIESEHMLEGVPIIRLLRRNHLASSVTINDAMLLIDTLKNILG